MLFRSGILIEPYIETYKQCCVNREGGLCKVYNSALVPFDYKSNKINLELHPCTAMNSIIKAPSENYIQTIEVEARTLQSILDENNISVVEFMYLDAEGYETQILHGIDFKKNQI